MRNQKSEVRDQKKLQRRIWVLFLSFSVFCSLSSVLYAASSAEILEEIPVQHNGRVKPFQSFAREASLNITGADHYGKFSATEMVWQWMSNPESWNTKPFIPVPRAIQKDFGPMLVKGRISPEVLSGKKSFIEDVQLAWAKRQRKDKMSPAEKYRLEMYDKMSVFQSIASGETPGFVAHPENPQAAWLPLQVFSGEKSGEILAQQYPLEKAESAVKALTALIDNIRGNAPEEERIAAARSLRAALNALFESRAVQVDAQHLRTELQYNRLHPFGWAWKCYLLASVLFMLSAFFSGKAVQKIISATAVQFWAVGFLVHFYGFILRCVIAGRPPVTNMYESVIWVSWAAVFFSMILFAVYRSILIPLMASLVASLALIVAESFPAVLDPSISPLVPVLRSNLWLTIHVMTITMSYGAFALAWGLGHAVVIGYVRNPDDHEGQKNLSIFLYRALQIGVILLAAGTILGGVWANYSWGRFWGWDPKETWALIALLGYLVVLHGRFNGWLDTFSAAAGSVIAFLGVLMAWYGVNFVLAAGLHSYGFGGGGAPYVLGIALLDLVLILGLMIRYKRKRSQVSGL